MSEEFAVVQACCVGLDVHQKLIQACLLTSGPGGSRVAKQRRFGTTTRALGELASWLAGEGCTHVALESTGISWRPVVNVLEDRFAVVVVNPQHSKALAGQKTDAKDAERLALLLRHGLLPGSFIPEREQRELRDLTRARAALVQDKARVVNRLHKTLESANLKRGAVLTEITGVSGQRIRRALLAGETDPLRLADLAHPRVQKTKRQALEEALVGTLTPALPFLVRQYLNQWQDLEARIADFDTQIAEQTAPLAAERKVIETLPAVQHRIAEIILAEVGTDLSRFPSAEHLAAWAGLAPGQHESAGKRRAVGTRHGNRHLRAALTQAAWALTRQKDGFLPARYRRLAKRLGPKRAVVAIARSLLVALDHVLTRRAVYQDLGADDDRDRAAATAERRSLAFLRARGYHITPPPEPTTEVA